jgi:hypothetical protein
MKPKTKKGVVKRQPKKNIIKRPVRKKIRKKNYNRLFIKAIIEVSEEGKSMTSAIKGKMSTQKFYELLSNDIEKSKQYARATQMRAEKMADETLEIADNFEHDVNKIDGIVITDHAAINRDRLRVDTRKWLLSKLHPKKYGDKIDMTSDGHPVNQSIQIEIINKASQVKKDDTEDSGS